MGNGSPRLLTRLIRRTAAVAIACLVFAPSALADNGVIGVATAAGPATVSASVSNGAVPTAQATVTNDVTKAAPVATTAAPHALPTTAAPQALQATVDTSKVAPASISVSATPSAGSSDVRPVDAQRRSRPTAIRHAAAQRPELVSPARPHELGATSSFLGSIRAASAAQHSHTSATSAAPLAPQLPDVSKAGFSGASPAAAGAAGTGLLLLLFVLLAEPFAFGLPHLGRRVPQLVAAGVPHPPLLRLERPD